MGSQSEIGARLRVGSFWFDPDLLSLESENGVRIPLRPQSLQVLHHLIRNAGQVVSKNDIISEVWQNHSVTDDSLVQCIAEIRRALGDSERTILRTFPKRGYMLNIPSVPDPIDIDIDTGAPVLLIQSIHSGVQNEIAARIADYGAEILSSEDTPQGFKIIARVPAISLALSLALCVAGKRVGDTSPAVAMDFVGPPVGAAFGRLSALGTHARSGGVLAVCTIRDRAVDLLDCVFTDVGDLSLDGDQVRVFSLSRLTPISRPATAVEANISPDDLIPTVAVIPPFAPEASHDAIIGRIFAEDLQSELALSQRVNVISRLSTAPFQSRSASLDDIRTALRADFVVSGTVLSMGDRVILTLELAEATSAHVLWADRLDVTATEIVQDAETVLKVIGHIQRALVLQGAALARKHALGTTNGHNVLMQAIHMMHRLTYREFMQARDRLLWLAERYPHHATPLAWLARWHVLRLQQGWSEDPTAEATSALDCAHHALDLDPENTLAMVSEGHVLTNLWRRLDEAKSCYDAALEINPNDANGRLLRGMLFGYQGLGEEATRDTERALHLAPLDPHRFFFLALAAGASLAAEDYTRALELSEQSLRLNCGHTSTLRGKIVAQVGLGQMEAARETAQSHMALQPGFRVSEWLRSSPACNFSIGDRIADALRDAGVPT